MEIDWSQVKKETLWDYETLIIKLLNVLNYGFVQDQYNHTMTEAISYAERMRQGYLQNGHEAAFLGDIAEHFRALDGLGIRNYTDLVQRVSTKAKCEAFLQETRFSFNALIQLLNYILRWVLPFHSPIKELVDSITGADTTYLDIL